MNPLSFYANNCSEEIEKKLAFKLGPTLTLKFLKILKLVAKHTNHLRGEAIFKN